MIKKLFTFPLAIILTLFIVKPYFQSGFPYTHDGENHLARFANYKIAIREEQFPPRFAPNLINHYGYPVFNYNYPLANIFSVPFSFLKINYEITFKILASFFVLMGLSGVYHWLDKLKVSYSGIMFGTAIYATSPFIWSTVLFRGNIGEIMAWGLFPWMLYLIESFRKKNKFNILKILLLTAFLLSHNIAVVFGIPLVIVYGLIRFGFDKKIWTKFLLTLGSGIALSLWFWLPAIAEKNLVNVGEVDLVNNFKAHFSSLNQLLFSPLNFGFSFPGKIDSLSFSLGITQLAILFINIILLAKTFFQKKIFPNIKLLRWFILGSILLILFQLKISLPIWKLVPLAAFIQFSWRLNLFLNVVIAGIAAISWSELNKKTKWLLFGLLSLQLISFLQLKPVDYFHKNNIDYDAFSQSTTTNNENLPRDFTYQEISDWQPTPQIINGEGEIKVNFWSGSKRGYKITAFSAVTIVEPTMNFAGWETLASFEGTKKKVNYFNDQEIQGRIAYELKEPGEYELITRFTQNTWPRMIGNGISIIALLIVLFLTLKKFLKNDLNFYLNWKIFLFLITLSASLLLVYDPSFPYAKSLLANSGLSDLIYSWANFDGVHYLTIIEKGYLGTGLIQAFFPLFPILVGGFNTFIHNPILAGLIFNFIVGFLLLLAWKKIVDLEMGVGSSNFGIYLLFLFPTAFFFNALYSEALFLFLVLTSFLSARKGKWLRAGILAALASATRLVGIFLVPALLVELWLQRGAWNKIKVKEIIYILLGGVGLLAYMVYLQNNFNDPLYFYHVQSEFGGGRQESLILYPQVVWRYLRILWTARPFDLKYFAYVQEFLFGTLGLIGLIWSWFKVRKSYVVFSILVFLLPTLTGTFSSMPRYFLVSFSAFLLMTKLLKDKKISQVIWLSLSTLWLIFNTILFIQGYWVA